MDPIESGLHTLFDFIRQMSPAMRVTFVMFSLGFLGMVLTMFRRNLLNGEDREAIKVWASMSQTMNNRIADLMPQFGVSMALLAKRYEEALQGNGEVVRYVQSIKASVKEKAEVDYCLQDADKDINVAMLEQKLKMLLKGENQNE